MWLPRAFRDAEDLADTLVLVEARLMPVLAWLDDLHDPDEQIKASAGVALLVMRRALVSRRFGSKDEWTAACSAFWDTVHDGSYDDLPDRRGGGTPPETEP